jgi:hypothetical protein
MGYYLLLEQKTSQRNGMTKREMATDRESLKRQHGPCLVFSWNWGHARDMDCEMPNVPPTGGTHFSQPIACH